MNSPFLSTYLALHVGVACGMILSTIKGGDAA